MASKWITAAPGIRYRQHQTRKHGARFDRYFTLRFSANGRQVEEALGWASEGWTVAQAQEELIRLRQAKRTGKVRRPFARRPRRIAGPSSSEPRRRLPRLAGKRSSPICGIATPRKWWPSRTGRAAQKTRIWRSRIEPEIGALKINYVTEEHAGKVVRAPLSLDEFGQVIGGKAEAGNIYRLLHHMFNKALGWGLRVKEAGNPLENVTEPKVARRERLLTGSEIGALMVALDVSEADGSEHPRLIAAIRVVILTGPRISEPLGLRWPEIRRDEMELHLSDTKSGFSLRPISARTLAVLDSMERMPGVDFVFRGIKDPTKPLSYNTVEKAFRRIAKKAGVQNCTLHTIRHWFSTMTANSVNNHRVGMALTGHKSHAAYMNYVHGDKEQARALADQLAALATGLADASSNLRTLRRKGE